VAAASAAEANSPEAVNRRLTYGGEEGKVCAGEMEEIGRFKIRPSIGSTIASKMASP
jgi:hypothetical protein